MDITIIIIEFIITLLCSQVLYILAIHKLTLKLTDMNLKPQNPILISWGFWIYYVWSRTLHQSITQHYNALTSFQSSAFMMCDGSRQIHCSPAFHWDTGWSYEEITHSSMSPLSRYRTYTVYILDWAVLKILLVTANIWLFLIHCGLQIHFQLLNKYHLFRFRHIRVDLDRPRSCKMVHEQKTLCMFLHGGCFVHKENVTWQFPHYLLIHW